MGYDLDDYNSFIEEMPPPEAEPPGQTAPAPLVSHKGLRSRADDILDAAGGIVRRKFAPACDRCQSTSLDRRPTTGGMQLLVCKRCNHKMPWASQRSVVPPVLPSGQVSTGPYHGPPREQPDRLSHLNRLKTRTPDE